MAKFKIIGQNKLNGDFYVSGAKNAALKMLAASVMIPGKIVLHNVPKILDIDRMIEVIESLGAKTHFENNTLNIDSTNINSFSPDEDPVKKLRGSVVIIGPLLGRFGKANFSEPGGCLIGTRPIDTHLSAFSSMGVNITRNEEQELYSLSTTDRFSNSDLSVVLEEMSVTATENVLMASVLRKGKTKIEICACEPEITDLANFLNKAGAKITGAGTHTIEVEGVEKLNSVEYTVIPDRIEAGTIAIAAALTGGKVNIKNIIPEHMRLVLNKLKATGVDFVIVNKDNNFADLVVEQKSELCAPGGQWIDTRPYPGFPTDLQSPFVVLLTQAKGRSRIFETLFSSRFDYVNWLIEMGAKIDVESPHLVDIIGPSDLKGDEIECNDLRGGAALVIAGLIAKGITILNKIEYVDRGYENFDQRLKNLGAEIERIN